MTYFEGFLLPVPKSNRETYRKQAAEAAPLLHDLGVLRHVEAWGSEVPVGKVTDFRTAVAAKEDEDVVFSWFEHANRDERDKVNQRIMTDPRMAQMNQVMPFDAQRMMFGGFDGFVEEGSGRGAYIDGFVTPVSLEKCDAYCDWAHGMSRQVRDLGAVRSVHAIADDVRRGDVTDYYRAVRARDDETFFFSFVEWPDRQTREEGWTGRYENFGCPFDAERRIRASFVPVLDSVWAAPVINIDDASPRIA